MENILAIRYIKWLMMGYEPSPFWKSENEWEESIYTKILELLK